MLDVKKKIIFFVANDWSFCNYRWAMALAVQAAGYEVHVVTDVEKYGERIEKAGFILHPLIFDRGSLNPLKNLRVLKELIRIYKIVKPDLVHHFAVKPILLGTLAAKTTKIPFVINSFTGLGYVFTACSLKAFLLRTMIKPLFRKLFQQKTIFIVVQNADDKDFLIRHRLALSSQITLIPGSGVDSDYFTVLPEPEGPFVITMVSRMLKDKGVWEFIAAAKKIKEKNSNVQFILAGMPDSHNPSSLDEQQLVLWDKQEIVQWQRFVFDIRALWQQSHVAVLLSHYREGLPRALLEAAACGKPLLATNVPGCRELVVSEKNGLLVQPHNSFDVVEKLERLMADKTLRIRLGQQARQDVETTFSDRVINQHILALYETIKKSVAK